MKNISTVLLSIALNHPPLQRPFTADSPEHPSEQADYEKARVALGSCANSSKSHESVFTRHHTEDTKLLVLLLFFL